MKKLIPEKVDGYRSETLNALIDCIIALWPVSSSTLLTNVTSRGTSYEVKRPGAAGGGSMPFSGTAYIAGYATTGLNSYTDKPWVRCFIDTATAEEHAGPPPNPFPANEEWYEKSKTSGDIHIVRG
jgi:hypothetical protein